VTAPASHNESDLPRLRIVPTASLLPHEEFDAQRSEPLIARLRRETELKNPPIVAPIEGDDRYVILDGTNRALAMRALAYRHIIVQIVDYDDPSLVLDTWFHLVTGMPPQSFFAALQSIDGLHVAHGELLHARAELARRQAAAYAIAPPRLSESRGAAHAPGTVYLVYAAGDIRRRTSLLNRLVGMYQEQGRIHRVGTDHLERLLPYYDEVTALVVFPRYEPSEIVELARQGATVPAGITRHIIPGRALRVNFPLAVLSDDRSLDEKNEWLQDWIRQRLVDKAVRYYQESTYLFDE
jgi:hypothetical protein